MLEIRGLQKSFHGHQVLGKLDLQVKEGEVFGFIGKNGAGKTTTMKIIAGLLKPDAGEIFLEGINTGQYGEKRKSMLGYMPDFFGVYDNLTVQEYMEFYASIYGYGGKAKAERIKELLNLMNLLEKKDQYVDSLSRGMKQRLCLARTIVHNPKLLLLDEPTSGLELRERIQFEQIVKKLSVNGVTIFISSHNLNDLSTFCTSVGILDQGRIVLQGSMLEIKNKKQSGTLIRMEVVTDLQKAAAVLKAHPLVSNIAIKGSSISIHFAEQNQEKESELLSYLVLSGVKISSFIREEGSLESVFLQVT